MDLLSFVRSLPKHWACAPIYANGVEMPKGGTACGKNPLGRAHYENLSPEAAALYIERDPETFQAIGVFTGSRSNGLVILDVDANLGAVTKKWGEDLEKAPKVTSPKKSAAKFFFYVPLDLWSEVSDISLAASNEGWEVLWGRQGLVGGAYNSGGEYTLEGDLNAIPEAPGWLLARMKESFNQKKGKTAVKGLRDGRWAMRSKEERVVIAASCLSVIQPQGRGSEDLWWRIGAMLHSELPDEEGLNLWREWSLQDAEYADDWANGKDPCLNRWEAGFKDQGGLGFGSLVKLADHYDPERARFQRDGCASVVEEIEAKPVIYARAQLSFDEVIEKAKSYLELDNPAEMNFNLNSLAIQAGYRDQVALEKLIVDQIQFEGAKGVMDVEALQQMDEKRDYLIPDVLPHPSVVLIYGAGGDGKSMTAWTLAKHIATGAPFVVRGKHMPIQQGPVLLLNGDQPLIQLKEQLEEVDYPMDSNTKVLTDWQLQRYAQFIKMMEKIQPKLVVIDSLIGCSGGRAFDENKSDFATPLYWLTRNNGVLFPAATILIIHHANKQGGFRGTSAIRDAVDETWALKKPSNEDVEKGLAPAHSRIVTIEKSRAGRSGTSLIMRQEDDLSFSVADFTPEVDPTNTAPGSVTDRVLQRLRTGYPRTFSRTDLNADPLVGGKVDAIRKSLQRLVKRGLVEVVGSAPAPDGKNKFDLYQAVLARGEVGSKCPNKAKPSGGADKGLGQKAGHTAFDGSVSQPDPVVGTPQESEEASPNPNPSAGAGSAPMGHSEQYPRARKEDRNHEELQQLRDNAWNVWDK
jgi:hypothetical protein